MRLSRILDGAALRQSLACRRGFEAPFLDHQLKPSDSGGGQFLASSLQQWCRGWSFLHILHSLHTFAGAPTSEPAVYKGIQIAIHDSLNIARFDARAQILHHAVRLKDVAADLVAPRNAALLPVKTFHFRFLRIDPLGIDTGEQKLHCRGTILMLRTLGL